MDYELLENEIILAERGNHVSRAVIREVLRPQKEDSVDLIAEKILIFSRLFFGASLKYEDAVFHLEIDRTYAEQIHHYLNHGVPKYKGLVIIGFRESAKTTRVKFCESYMSVYLYDLVDSVHLVSEDGGSSTQFNMDMWNILGVSKIQLYYGDIILDAQEKKKENQTMAKFTTTKGVTYSATSARKSKRGNVKMDVTDDGEIETKRPKKVIFDDIENETTIRSVQATHHIASVIQATIDGIDQVMGSWVLLGNYLSLRGNVDKYLKKAAADGSIKAIVIPIMDGLGNPIWPDKYVRTDKEELELAEKGIVKRSIESIERNTDNFQTEFMNNPKRSSVYFEDDLIAYLENDELVGEKGRTEEGLLITEQPEHSATYVISADSGKGNGGDQSAFTVWKLTGIRYKEVANFKSNKLTPEKFAGVTANTGRLYNNAMIIPENNFPGNEFIAFLIPIYTNIFISQTKKDSSGKDQHEYGINTNLKTKPEMMLNAKRLFKDKVVEVTSQALYNQILDYPAEEVLKITRDNTGGHFDLWMSAVIGLWKAAAVGVQQFADERKVDAALKSHVDKIFKKNNNRR